MPDSPESLDALLEAAQSVAEAEGSASVRRRVVERGKKLFKADSCTLWPYDDASRKFIPSQLVAEGISDGALEDFRKEEPRPGHLTYTVLDEGVLSIENTQKGGPEYGPEKLHPRLHEEGIRSLVGVVVRAGTRTVGVLYVAFKEPRPFSAAFVRLLRNFSKFAGLSLRKERLHEQVRKAHKGSRGMADVLASDAPDEALQLTIKQALEVLECDSVVIYLQTDGLAPEWSRLVANWQQPYQSGSPRTGPPVITTGRGAIPIPLRGLTTDPPPPPLEGNGSDYGDLRAVSATAVPLRAAGLIVGCLVVNYYSSSPIHRFIEGELESISACADLVAFAVSQEKNWRERGKRLEEREKLRQVSVDFLGNLRPQEILDLAVAQGMDLLGTEFCHILFPEKGGYRFAAVAGGWPKNLVEEGFTVPGGKRSLAGYTAKMEEVVAVEDFVTEDRFDPPPIHKKFGIVSSLLIFA